MNQRILQKVSIFLLLLTFKGLHLIAQSVSVSLISAPPFCAGQTIQVSINKTGSPFTGSSVLSLEISNGAGVFSVTPPTIPISPIPTIFPHTQNVLLPDTLGTNGTGYKIRVALSNPALGTTLGQTGVFVVNPMAQVNQPANQVVCNTDATSLITFGTTNSGGTTTFSWTNDNITIGLAANGTNTPTIPSFTAINTGTSPVTATIEVTPTFTNGAVSCSGPAESFTITVNPTAQVNQPANQVVCNTDATSLITFGTSNSGGTTTYSWTNDNTSIGLAASGTNTPTIPSFNAINTGTSPVTATIEVTPIFTNGSVSCSGPAESFTITVNPTAQVNQPTNQVVCNTDATSLITFGTSNSGGTTTYSWTNDNTSIGLAASGTNTPTIPSFTAINTGTSPVTATIEVTPTFTNGSVSCSGPTESFTITVNPTAKVNQPANQEVCNTDATLLITFGTTNTGGTTTYSWTNDNITIGLAASGTNTPTIPSFTAINTGTVPVTATIVVTPTFTNGAVSCAGPTKTFTIRVNPTPIVLTSDTSICSGSNLPITMSTAGNARYYWTYSNGPGQVFSGASENPIGSSAFPYSSSLNFNDTLINNGIDPDTLSYIFTPISVDGCKGIDKTINVTINPGPQVVMITNPDICSNKKTNIHIQSNIDIVFSITDSVTNTNINGLAGTYSSISSTEYVIQDSLINADDSLSQSVSYIVTMKSVIDNNCILVNNIPQKVNPLPILNPVTPNNICSGTQSNIALGVSTGSNTASFSWLADSTNTNFILGAKDTSSPGNAQMRQFLTNVDSTNLHSIKFYITPTVTSTGCVGKKDSITQDVWPKPVMNSSIVPAWICSGFPTSIGLADSVSTPSKFTWTVVAKTPNLNSITGDANATTDTLGPIVNTLQNTSDTVTATVTYLVTPKSISGQCIGNAKAIVQTVQAKPTLKLVSYSNVCEDSSTNISLVGSTLGPNTFAWEIINADSYISGYSPVSSPGPLSVIAQTLFNSTDSLIGSIDYKVQVTSPFNCKSDSTPRTMKVHPKPSLKNLVTDFAPQCDKKWNSISLKSTTDLLYPGLNRYIWSTNSATGKIIGGSNPGSFIVGQISDSLTNLSAITDSLEYIISAKSGFGCVGVPSSYYQVVYPTPILVTKDTFPSICSGQSTLIPLKDTTDVNCTFTWQAVPNTNFMSGHSSSTNPTSDTIKQILFNNSPTLLNDPLSGSVKYLIVPTSSHGCIGDTSNITQTVFPTPTPFTIITPSVISDICNNSSYKRAEISRSLINNEYLTWKGGSTSTKFFLSTDTSKYALILQPNNSDVITVTSKYTISGCQFETTEDYGTIVSKVNPRLILKSYPNNHAVLVCLANDIKQSVGYKWGTTQKSDLVDSVFVNEHGQEYYLKGAAIPDTNSYFYWVEIKFDNEECSRRIYLEGNEPNGKQYPIIVEDTYKNQLAIYPNPVQSNLTVEITGKMEGKYSLEIHDMTGNVIKRLPVNTEKVFVSLDELRQGYYLITCRRDGVHVETKRFIKN